LHKRLLSGIAETGLKRGREYTQKTGHVGVKIGETVLTALLGETDRNVLTGDWGNKLYNQAFEGKKKQSVRA